MAKIARYLPFFIVLAAMSLIGCEGGKPNITVEGARAELSPVIRGEGIVYLRIVNTGGKDTLTHVKVDIPGATAVLHAMRGNFMVQAKTMRIPARNIVELKPMSSHIMIENMPRDVKEGQPLTVTLVFEKSGEKQIPLVLMKGQPMTQEKGHENQGH